MLVENGAEPWLLINSSRTNKQELSTLIQFQQAQINVARNEMHSVQAIIIKACVYLGLHALPSMVLLVEVPDLRYAVVESKVDVSISRFLHFVSCNLKSPYS